MFDLRLGLALGKSLGEIRALPYPEIQKWRLFYLLEPWGWSDREYRTSVMLAQVNNVHATKKKQLKKSNAYVRDMFKQLVEAIHKKLRLEEQSVAIDLSTPEGRAQATENTIKLFQSIFGKRVERKDKQ